MICQAAVEEIPTHVRKARIVQQPFVLIRKLNEIFFPERQDHLTNI